MTLEEDVLGFLATQPPTEIANVIQTLHRVNPALDDVLQKLIPFPLRIADDPSTGKHCILSDFNKVRQGCFRSPWTGAVVDLGMLAITGELALPPYEIRRVEVALNELYMSYCSVYFGSSSDFVSSVYLYQTKAGFEGAFLAHRQIHSNLLEGVWDAVHVIKYNCTDSAISCYSSVFCVADFPIGETGGQSRLEISRERSIEDKKCGRDEESVIRAAGEAVEDNENVIRRLIESVHLEKLLDNLRNKKVVLTADPIFSTLPR